MINGLISYFFVRDLTQYPGRVARTLDCVDPSTPRRWRGGWLGHHGCSVLPVGVVLWLSSRDVTSSSHVKKWCKITLRLRLIM